jgi:DNA-binding CsgD family transcriptional regulator
VRKTVARDDLTLREREILELVVRGLRNREIATAIGISERTVEWNLSRVYRKLGVQSKLELVARLAEITWARTRDE